MYVRPLAAASAAAEAAAAVLVPVVPGVLALVSAVSLTSYIQCLVIRLGLVTDDSLFAGLDTVLYLVVLTGALLGNV